MKKSNMVFIRKLSTILMGIASVLAGYADTYYVSPAGDDTNSGKSVEMSWQTVSRLNRTDFEPGDSILFEANKLFRGQIYFDSNDGNDSVVVVTIGSYGGGRAIIGSEYGYGLFAYNTQGIAVRDLIFTGAGMVTGNDGIVVYSDLPGNIKLKNISITNVEVMNYGGNGITIGTWNALTGYQNVVLDDIHVHHVMRNGIEFYGFYALNQEGWAHQEVVVRDCRVHDIPGYESTSHKGSGIILGQVNGGVVEYCTAYNNGIKNTASGGPGGIWAWDCNDILIQYCESHHNRTSGPHDGLGFDFDGGVQNSVMQYNYSHDNDGAGFLLGQFPYARDWFNNVVRYNLSVNDGRKNSGSISIFKAPGTAMHHARIYNNTIYNTNAELNPNPAAFNFIQWGAGIDSVEAYNNIFFTGTGVPVLDIPLGYRAFFAGNLYWCSGDSLFIRDQDTIYRNLQAWRKHTGNETLDDEARGVFANPNFEDSMEYDSDEDYYRFALSDKSPAIDQGIDLQWPDVEEVDEDFVGVPTPSNGGFDIGAFERIYEENQMLGGMDELEKTSGLSIYPNPATRLSPVRMESSVPLTRVQIYALDGRMVWHRELGISRQTTIPVEGLTSGQYLVRAYNINQQIMTQKLLLQ